MFVSEGITAAMPGRSMPGRVRNLIVVAATAAPVWPGADDRGGVAFFHQIDRAADGRIFFPPHRVDGAIGHLDDLGGVHDLDRGGRCSRVFSVRPRSAAYRRRERACRCGDTRSAP